MDRRLLAITAGALSVLSGGVAAALTMNAQAPSACTVARANQPSHQPSETRLNNGGTVVFEMTNRPITAAERLAILCYVEQIQTRR